MANSIDYYVSAVVYALFAVATLGFALGRCVQGNIDGKDATVDKPAPVDVEAAADPSARRTRYAHLDNLKVLLTVWVVVFHCIFSFGAMGKWITGFAPDRPSFFKTWGCWAIDLSDSFFMGLFFLLSAYFTPASYDNKGCLKFLQDKFYRLGIPTLACTTLLYPLLLYWFIDVVDQLGALTGSFWDVWTQSFPFYFILWFTFDLLLANCAYAAVRKCSTCFGIKRNAVKGDMVESGLSSTSSSASSCSDSCSADDTRGRESMECGTFLTVFFAAWLLLSGLTVALRNAQFQTFGITPVRNLPQYVAYFVFGLFAKRCRWLECLEEPGPSAKWVTRVAAFSSATTLLGVYLGGYMGDPSWESYVGSTVFVPSVLEAGEVNAWWFKWLISPGLLNQLFGLSFTCVLLERAPKWLRVSNVFTQFMANAAYAAYVTQPFVLFPVFWCFKLMVGWKGARDGLNMPPGYQNEGWIWLGFLFQAGASNLILWPLAGVLRKIPGIRTIL